MSAVNIKNGNGSLRKQLITGAAMCALAVVVIVLSHRGVVPVLLSGLPFQYQCAIGIAAGALYWVMSVVGSKFITNRKTTQTIADNYARLDLDGYNPLWIALAAGLGEELLFRGALQPVLGIWVTSVLFVLVHIRAYRLNTLDKRVLVQSASIFAISVVLGFTAVYAGLITAILVHAELDIVGLYAIRRMTRAAATMSP